MKFMRRKLSKGTALLFFSFVAVSVCCIILSNSMRVQTENEKSSRNFYSRQARRCTIYEYEDTEQFWVDYLSASSDRKFTLYYLLWESEMDIRGVYSTKFTYIPPMIKGRFFELEEVQGKSQTAVIGRNYEDDIVTENGIEYYYYYDTAYEVVGIMGTEEESRTNQMIFLDFYSAVETGGTEGSYVVDARSQNIVDFIITDLERTMASRNGKYTYSAKDVSEGIDRLFEDQYISQSFYGLILLCFLLSASMVSMLWISYKRNKAAVWMMNGYGIREITTELLKEYLRVIFCAYICSLLCMILAGWQQDILSFNGRDILFSIAMTSAFGILTVLYPIGKTIRMDISTMMR